MRHRKSLLITRINRVIEGKEQKNKALEKAKPQVELFLACLGPVETKVESGGREAKEEDAHGLARVVGHQFVS